MSRKPPDAKAPTQGDDNAFDAVHRVRQACGSGETVLIERLMPDGKEWEYCDRWPAEQFTLDLIVEKFGGGRYRVSALNELGKYKAGGRGEVRIGGAPKAIRPADAAPAGNDPLMLVLNELRAQRAQPAATGKDPMEIAMAIAQMQGATMAAVLGIVPQLLKGGGGEQRDPVAMMRDLIEIKRELEPEPRDDAPLKGEDPIYRSIAVPLLGLLNKIADNSKGQRPSLPPAPAGAPAAPPSAPAHRLPEAPPVKHPLLAQIGPYLPDLVRLADADKDVELYGDLILDQLPEDAYGALGDAIRVAADRDKFLVILFEAYPDLEPRRAWFKALLTHLGSRFAEDAEDPETPAATPDSAP